MPAGNQNPPPAQAFINPAKTALIAGSGLQPGSLAPLFLLFFLLINLQLALDLLALPFAVVALFPLGLAVGMAGFFGSWQPCRYPGFFA